MNASLPFQIGRRYRVIRDYAFLNHAFRAGEEVIFTAGGYSPYDGVTRYWFTSVQSGKSNAWHQFDAEEQASDSNEFFEPVVNA